MSDKDYEKLLENAYVTIPEKVIGTGERFEMPKFEFFTEGNKTIIKNFALVCDKIRRDALILSKYMSKELAVPLERQGDRLILQRRITGDIINKKLEEFTNKYVLCKECKKPDTHIEELGHGLKQLICEACGARNSLR